MTPVVDPVAWLAVACVLGYLSGSFSGARIIGRLVAPTADVTRVEMRFDDGSSYESRAASASAVRANVGTRWGVVTGILDASKVAGPILVARALGYGESVQLAIAVGALIGHVAPLYHRFRGGLGESVTYGALLVFDPIGVLASIALAVVTGFVVGRVVALREGAVPIFVAWSLVVRGDVLLAAFTAFAVLLYRLAVVPESRRYVAAVHGHRVSNEEISREYGMGARLGRAIDRYGLPSLLRRG